MGISIGGIDISEALINAEYRLGVLERIIDRLIPVVPPGTITESDMAEIRKEVLTALQQKYPDAGISEKSA